MEAIQTHLAVSICFLADCYEFESHGCLYHFILSRQLQYFIGMTDQVQSVSCSLLMAVEVK